jgi:hypothetical protein
MQLSFALLSAFTASAYAASGLCVADHYKLTAGECVVGGTVYDCDSEFPCTKTYNVSEWNGYVQKVTSNPDRLARTTMLLTVHYRRFVDQDRSHVRTVE